ncbi:hypothetical protein [Crenobacter cavernae]|uniref:hypothetical protein n=1 Tax=Crenobacter cavernae TaxID=2290923 RepID=UPI0011C0318C|nr:hypothetical protein [Crenobacter cavernae]
MMSRFISVCCLLVCLALQAGEVAARERGGPHDREYAERQDEPPRRLRDLRMKEAIRYGDLSPEEARSPNRDYRRLSPPGAMQRDDDRGRQRWRDTQRRSLEDRD